MMSEADRRRAAWLASRERVQTLRTGMMVEPTAAADERYYGLVGQIIYIKQPVDWLPAMPDESAVLVDWYDPERLSEAAQSLYYAGRLDEVRGLLTLPARVYLAHKHKLAEIKLAAEEWDASGKFPAPPEPVAEQMRIGG